MDYIGVIAKSIRDRVPDDLLPDEKSSLLFRLYAVLVLSKGTRTTSEDVHDAWSAWIAQYEADHAALVPYSQLSAEQRQADEPYLKAIHAVSMSTTSTTALERRLFPSGLPLPEARRPELLDLYKMLVGTSESLVSRRQNLNTFFLTVNGALLTVTGLLVGSSVDYSVKVLGLLVVTIIGVIFGYSWHNLIRSYGQLNTGKFSVINRLEQELVAAVFEGEWVALGEGKDPKVYRPFTSRETWAPWLFGIGFAVALVITVLSSAHRWFPAAIAWFERLH